MLQYCFECWCERASLRSAHLPSKGRAPPGRAAATPTPPSLLAAAKNQVAMNPHNTIFDAKRLIGRKFNESAVQSDMKHWPFKVVSGPAEKPLMQVEYKGESKTFAAEEVSAMVLTKVRDPHSLQPFLFPSHVTPQQRFAPPIDS